MFFYSGKIKFTHNQQLELQTFQLEEGWGYQILIDGKIFIYQPTIPAIASIRSFPDEKSALRVGTLVLKRIKLRKEPVVTLNEVSCLLY